MRFEEVTRCPAEVQDALITILSEKVLAIPELGQHVHARRGFSMIGTANTRDRGVNDMSAALKRRFNIVVLPVPDDLDTEVRIVMKRVADIGSPAQAPRRLRPQSKRSAGWCRSSRNCVRARHWTASRR